MIRKTLVFIFALTLLSTGMALAAGSPVTGNKAGKEQAHKASYLRLPLSFVKNEGQKDKAVLFYDRGAGHGTSFTMSDITLSLATPKGTERVTLTPLQASTTAVEPLDRKQGKINYLKGNDPSQWKTDIPTYGAILYKDVYPGIDMKFYGTNSRLEYDVIVAPQADPGKVRLSYEGIEGLNLTPDGELEIILAHGSVIQKKPVITQTAEGKKTEVTGAFALLDKTTYTFVVGPYDKERTLVIDPVFEYSTYLGGTGADSAWAIALDASGNIYVAGYTESGDFPTLHARQAAYAGTRDAFVTKLDAKWDSLVFSTYLGGSGTDEATSLAVDAAGNVYLAGNTLSTNFPVYNAYQAVKGAGYDGFVTKLDPTGRTIVFSTYLGGSQHDYINGMAVDAAGNVYVAGYTVSPDFPVAGAYQATKKGEYDAFVTKLGSGGYSLVYSTYLGGSDYDFALGMALDSSGNVYVTGYTASDNFPVVGAYQAARAGHYDAFVTKLDPTGATLTYSTYLGGQADDRASAIAVDASGYAYVAGYTMSSDFPTKDPYQASPHSDHDAFVTKLDPTGATLANSTFLGGTSYDAAQAIAVDAAGNVLVAGTTASSDFPGSSGYYFGGASDGFVTRLALDGSRLVFSYSNLLGGGDTDEARAITIDQHGNPYVTGYTESTNFPVANAHQSTSAGSADLFIAKLVPLLAVLVSGGPGTVVVSPSGTACADTCYELLDMGAEVTLTAYPGSGYKFAYWARPGCKGQPSTCTFTLTYDKVEEAYFVSEKAKQVRLSASKRKISGGDGTIVTPDGEINCGRTCSATFYQGTGVGLYAVPAAGSALASWGGACAGTDPSRACVVRMDKAKTATATFAGPQKLTVRKQKLRKGDGTVTSSVTGIDCGTTCAASFTYGTAVTLTPTPAAGSAFTGWIGACTGAGACTVTMDRAKLVTARFTKQ